MTDKVIIELHANPGRRASEAEIQAIRDRLTSVGFPERVRIPLASRGLSASGYTLGRREDSLIHHLVRRIVLDEQWTDGTTPEQYLADLRASIKDNSARFGVGKPQGNSAPLVYVFAGNLVPQQRRGRRDDPFLFVLYGVADGVIITGHMVSGADAVRKADDFRWLR
ncbi:MAG: hypothetical protein H0U55_12915 [Rubrobacteraceae bacterium]|nr:hypothetical protein [Rubrobacteraceae bacterium]